jgi:hypothetical protein
MSPRDLIDNAFATIKLALDVQKSFIERALDEAEKYVKQFQAKQK